MNHFNASTIRKLAKRGIVVYSTTFIPDASGSFANGETAYKINDNGTGRIWTFLEVLKAAA